MKALIQWLVIGSFYCSLPLQAQQTPFKIVMGADCHVGLLDHQANELLATEYATIREQSIGNDWLITAENKAGQAYFLYQQSKLIPLTYGKVEKLNEQLLKIGDRGRYGLINTVGKGIALAQYDAIESAGHLYALTLTKQGYGVLDNEGKAILANKYRSILYWEQGGFWAKKSTSFQWFDEKGKAVKEANYDAVQLSKAVLPICAVSKNGQWGVLNNQNELVVPCEYKEVVLLAMGGIAVQKNQKWTLLDMQGNPLLKQSFAAIVALDRYAVLAEKGEKQVILNNSGKELLKLSKKGGVYLGNGWFSVPTQNGTVQIFDIPNQQLLPHTFDAIQHQPEDWAGVLIQKDKKWGWLGFDGKIAIQPTFVDVNPYLNGTILVEDDYKKLGLLNSKGKQLLPCAYISIVPKHSFFKVQQTGKPAYYVNENNQMVDCQVF